MPREPRIYIEKVLYLVTAKGDEDRDLFSDSQDFNAYLKSLGEYKREYGFKLFAFALLPKSLLNGRRQSTRAFSDWNVARQECFQSLSCLRTDEYSGRCALCHSW